MAKFNGTLEEFEKFVGPRLRNVVQTSLSRKYKQEIGKCEECKTKKNLESAHVHSNDRKKIIRDALDGHLLNNIIIDLDLIAFEDRFIKLHNPLNKTFIILCKECHRKYDNIKESIEIEDIEPVEIISIGMNDTKETLEIEFTPNDILEFKELLLLHQRAYIITYYQNNTKEIREWNASRMTEKSDIIGNLRSRPEFRQGNWQALNIKRVEVSIID